MPRLPKQLTIKNGVLNAKINLSGFNGFRNSPNEVRNSIRGALDHIVVRIKNELLTRFDKTRGDSKWAGKPRKKGGTQFNKGSVGRIESWLQTAHWSEIRGENTWVLTFADTGKLRAAFKKHVLRQELGWRAFADFQPYKIVNNNGKVRFVPITKRKAHELSPQGGEGIIDLLVAHPAMPGRNFITGTLSWWNSRGIKEFNDQRLAILRKLRRA